MRKVFFSLAGLFAVVSLFAQNVGVGITTPTAPLHVKSTTNNNPLIIDGANFVYSTIAETGLNRGYFGSYAGNPEDVDFGTYTGNATGKIHFTIQATPKMTINSTGDVGIGTTTPNYRLQVAGGDLFINSNSGALRLGYDGLDQWEWATTGGGTTLLMANSTNGSSWNYYHNFAQNGNLGIGTGLVAPAARLHVSTTASEVIRMQGASPYLSFYDNTDGYRGYLYYNSAANSLTLGSSFVPVKLGSSGGTITLNQDGRVSIGSGNTLATGYLLNVDGKIISEELKIQLSGSWPDYVFADDYHLLPIEDLEKSIRENKHLPNIPSASEVTADKGFEIGDMNKRILEKVEELTLYIIQLKKENTQLKERLDVVEKKQNNQ